MKGDEAYAVRKDMIVPKVLALKDYPEDPDCWGTTMLKTE